MTKQTKMLLGLAAVAGVGYYAYTQWKKSKTSGFANLLKQKGSCCPPNERVLSTFSLGKGVMAQYCSNSGTCVI